jgi:hypothetical protein
MMGMSCLLVLAMVLIITGDVVLRNLGLRAFLGAMKCPRTSSIS